MMASRVTLLLFTVVLFAGMWSGDQKNERVAVERLLAERAASKQQTPRPTMRNASRTVGTKSVRRGEWTAASIPLPVGIAVGTYLIVDGRGRTETRVVTTKEAFPDGLISGHVAADQYTVRQGHDRWHFIRLDSTAATLAAHRASVRTANSGSREASLR